MAKLIVYYSRADENYFGDSIRNVTEGNTEKIAKKIASINKGTLFKIEQKIPYSKNYEDCTREAMADLKNNARPELVNIPESIDEYDEIYLGFPNYWGTMPMAVFTFLEKFDWKRKRIYPFTTHEGSGMGLSEGDIKKLCRGAMVMKGLAIKGSNIYKVEDMIDKEIEKWLFYGM